MNRKYYEYRIHKECPECAYPLIINGPFLGVACHSCGATIHLSKEFWRNRFTMSEDGGVMIRNERIGSQPGKMKSPRCSKCDSKLDVKTVENGSSALINCNKCGTAHSSYPPPDWMKSMHKEKMTPVQIFCAEQPEDAAVLPAAENKLIAFSCINCSAALELNNKTPRIMHCSFCNTQQFLPGALWHALHPVKRMCSWYVRYE